ncbi:hypothetical protein J6590_008309 [Homalodisca vitripennis]|nr:hypothetical protein J6590_008309 [Homalodisca vitripennis]
MDIKLCFRVAELERQLADNCNILPPVIKELKNDVEKFRERLETTKHLSWLNQQTPAPRLAKVVVKGKSTHLIPSAPPSAQSVTHCLQV